MDAEKSLQLIGLNLVDSVIVSLVIIDEMWTKATTVAALQRIIINRAKNSTFIPIAVLSLAMDAFVKS